ncbi:Arginine--tRNA ligase [Rubripirellula lacrimiformis]|uniref:Arginine--tRNA ligase n=1 Tax=Rubripirellula lacrimiformis TaxID=1930273 RepID=A0A517N8G3_9BACT|nr:arginine--tRNA ligase [Rubripirellula lacrimiformis]QDT03423.1 Arginine--tRNA ligase [Rubripirellula lacrimiformis]
MHIPQLLQQRFVDALKDLTDDPDAFASMIRSTTDPNHGDYQCNSAMPLCKALKQPSREVAETLVSRLKVDDLCETPTVAGPGFINLKLRDEFLTEQLRAMLGDARCGVAKTQQGGSIVIDFSSPNVAKPMHVGHIRSTVIGDALARTLKFLGYQTITDNHLGDWGTQFGIIIYGYRHFGDPQVVNQNPVPELSKLYRHVNQLIEYRKALASKPKTIEAIETATNDLAAAESSLASLPAKEQKKAKKNIASQQRRIAGLRDELQSLDGKIQAVESDAALMADAQKHSDIDTAVLQETAKLHRGDPENLALWEQFLPFCKDEINRIYDRLDIQFDHTLGESFYHPMLGPIVEKLETMGLASQSDGATCVFLDGFDAPMIVRKQDGAFLYATTDLATLEYRLKTFQPAEIVYVVDSRQSEHFEKLFAVADAVGTGDVKLVHVNFGTVLGEDGKPMKTRSGSLIGLESLLDDAVDRAKQVVCNPDRLENFDPPMDESEQEAIAEIVGIGAIKFADLGHHRTSDYRFNLDKMVALDGNTSAYVQYSYARIQKILERAEKAESDVIDMVESHGIQLTHPAERNLALMLLKFEEALVAVHKDYAPNMLVDYLLETAKVYSKFNESCHVLRAESPTIQATRLMLVALCGRILGVGLNLLGVGVVQRM